MNKEERPVEDFGIPYYVEAHGGKNQVILYRSRSNPALAIEFFYRSCSKDGRSRYYRCTNCWYLYKNRRGSCATLIVRDGRIITDPENPTIPHQCQFRPIEVVKANRTWIASRRKRGKRNNMGVLVNNPPEILNPNDITGIVRAILNDHPCASRPDSSLMHGTSKISSPSEGSLKDGSTPESCESPDSAVSLRNVFESCIEGTNDSNYLTFRTLLKSAFQYSMENKYNEAREQLKLAHGLGTAFDADDAAVVDNVFSCLHTAAEDPDQKFEIINEWLHFLFDLSFPPIMTSKWLMPHQFSTYYCYHLMFLDSQKFGRGGETKRAMYKIARSIFRKIMNLANMIDEAFEDIVVLKLDILVSVSYICGQYSDVGDGSLSDFCKEELAKVLDSIPSDFQFENENSIHGRRERVEKNLDQQFQTVFFSNSR